MDSITPIRRDMDAAEPDDAGDAAQPRRERDSLFLMARFQVEGDPVERDVRIRNLSEGGLMAEFDRAVDIGTAVKLDVRGIGPIAGKVAWSAEGRLGIALDAPVDPKRARKPVGAGAKAPFYVKPVARR